MWSTFSLPGDTWLYNIINTAAIINVLQSPTNESFNTYFLFYFILVLVYFHGMECMNSCCTLLLYILLKPFCYLLFTNKLLFISAPSNLVTLSELVVSAPLSLPAKSINENLPCYSIRNQITSFIFFLSTNDNCKTACDLDESAFAPVLPMLLASFP